MAFVGSSVERASSVPSLDSVGTCPVADCTQRQTDSPAGTLNPLSVHHDRILQLSLDQLVPEKSGLPNVASMWIDPCPVSAPVAGHTLHST